MSTLKTNNIEHLDASTPSIQTTIGGGTILAGVSTVSGALNVGTGTSISSPATNTLALGTNNTERLRIDSGGAVNIGDVWADDSDPMVYISKNSDVGTLTLKGNGTGTNNAFAIYGGGWSGATDNKFAIRADGSVWGGQTSLRFGTGSTYTERLHITSAGEVGIGTDNPQHFVHILDGGSSNILTTRIQQESSNTPTDGGSLLQLGGTRSNGTFGNYGGIFGGRRNQAGDNTGYLAFYVDDNDGASMSERVRITHQGEVQIANGNLKFSTAGTGIDFSATADGSGTVTSELLDDYEEGNWTPGVQQGGWSGISGLNSGKYVKIGAQVFVQCFFNGFTGSGSAALMQLNGLPFSSISSGYSAGSVDIGKGSVKGMYIRTESGSDRIGFYYPSESASSRTAPQGNSFYHDGYIILHLSYFTNS